MLPKVISSKQLKQTSSKRLLIIAEGFELRSLSWIQKQQNIPLFDKAIIVKYFPGKKSKSKELQCEVSTRTAEKPYIMKYNRFNPTVFEQEFRELSTEFEHFHEIYIDITVMSKLLIMILINELKGFNHHLHIIYTEPRTWGPKEEKFQSSIITRRNGIAICLSSVGVGDIVRTPGLSSIIMQDCPTILIAFLSFNEQLVNILINEMSPEQIIIINQACSRIQWRESAIRKIHEGIIDEYDVRDKINMFTYSLKEYNKVFEKIASVYKDNWIMNRLVVAPTGYKLHAVACALIKICCPDIHIEYPTPESYLFNDYSSDEVIDSYDIHFRDFRSTIEHISNEYDLNG